MDDDLFRYLRGRLRALTVAEAAVEERMVTGVFTTLEGYREAVGLRRGLETARSLLVEPLTEEGRTELASR